jgi:hypothetical protein
MTGALNINLSSDSERQPALFIGQQPYHGTPIAGADAPQFVAGGNALIYNPGLAYPSFIVLQAPDSETPSARLVFVDNFQRKNDDDPSASIEFVKYANEINTGSLVRLTYSGTDSDGYTLQISSPWGEVQHPPKPVIVNIAGNIQANNFPAKTVSLLTADLRPGESEDLSSEEATRGLMALNVARQGDQAARTAAAAAARYGRGDARDGRRQRGYHRAAG